jgi:transcriptional regulator with XRE-family HTH domain
MVNIDKIKSLCKQKGIKLKYLCDQFGVAQVYLNDVAKGKNTMSEDRIMKCAEILGTSFEYLIDLTDDPEPNFIGRTAEALHDKVSLILASVAAMSDEEQEILHKLAALPEEKREKLLAAIDMMIE